MRKILFIFSAFFCFLYLRAQEGPLVLTFVTIVDMVSEKPKTNMTIVINGNKINSISKKANLPNNARIIDAKGKYLIPGLWDMHVHIRRTESISFPLFIVNGVTGIREMHYPGRCTTIGQWKDSLARENVIALRVGAAAGCILDGPGDERGSGFIVVKNEEQARQEVKNLKENGADFVKIYSLLPITTYQAIADEAKKQSIPFAGHIPLSITVKTFFKGLQKCTKRVFPV